VRNRFRGVTPEPGAWTTIDDRRLKVLDLADAPDAAPLPPGRLELVGRRLLIGTGTAPLELRRVQPAGRTAMAAADWWRGAARDRAVAR
jgi:methionyl-tRNA formyltransferase